MEEADLERQAEQAEPPQRQEMRERSPGSTILRRFTDLRPPTIASLMSRRSSRNVPQPRPSSSNYDNEDLESPKSPRFSLGMPNLPSTRLHLPNLSRTWTQGSNGPPSRPGTARSQHTGRPSLSRARPEGSPVIAEPMPAVPAEHVRPSGRSHPRGGHERLDAPDPAESHLASMVNDGRRRRRHGRSASERNRAHEGRTQRRGTRRRGESSRRPPPKRFMFCLPWIRSRRIRSQILRCFVSGMFLTLLLSVCKCCLSASDVSPGNKRLITRCLAPDLALSITKNINNSEFTVLLILIILFTTIFFCHGLIRLCMLIVKPRSEEDERRGELPQMYGPGGYAIPRRPIRVVLARDEEAAGIESETVKTKPPAYGLWRESVVRI